MQPYLVAISIVLLVALLVEGTVHIISNREKANHDRINNILVRLFSDLAKCKKKEIVYSKILNVFIDIFRSAEKGSFALIDEKNMSKMYFAAIEGYSNILFKETLNTNQTYLYKKNRYSGSAIIKKPLEYIKRDISPEVGSILLKEKKGVNQILVTPIYGHQKVCGVISIDSFGKKKFRKRDVKLMKYFINRMSYLLEYFVTKSRMDYNIDIDSLTKTYSRNYFYNLLNREIENRRIKDSIFLAIFDIDNFKRINDTYGHIIGDEVLADFGAKLMSHCKANECVCGRIGGDEFGILAKNKDVKYMEKKIKDIRRDLRNNPYKKQYKFEFSYGFVVLEKNEKMDAKSLINKADLKMYELKKSRKRNG